MRGAWFAVCRRRDHGRVPRISSFYGIVIAMYFRDHHPPHFHAIYAEYEAQIVIETLEPLAGALPSRALKLVQEWAEMHRAELEANWARAEAHLPLDTIEPLP
jgi:hypothetical protein